MFAANHPEFMGKLATTNSTYRSSDGKSQVTFDYLVTEGKDKPPTAVLTTAISDTPGDWGASGSGIDGIDKPQRAKILSQMLEAGVDTGHVAVMINSHDYRDYTVHMTDELRAEAESNRAKAATIHNIMEQAKKLPFSEREVPPMSELRALAGHPVRTAPKDFPDAALTTDSRSRAKEEIFSHVALASGESVATVRENFDRIMARSEPSGNESEQETRQRVKDGLKELYRGIDFASRPIAAVDIVSTSRDATKARIADIGVVVKDLGSGEVHYSGTENYHVPESHVSGFVREYGREPRIDNRFSKRTVFDKNDSPARKLFDEAYPRSAERGGGDVRPLIVSHNPGRDKNLLRAHVKGFAEAEARGDVQVFDTSVFAQRMAPGAYRGWKTSFYRESGVDVSRLRSTLEDATHMISALENHNLHRSPRDDT